MIVEDDLLIATHIKSILKNLGFDVLDVVSSGEEALAKTEALRPDLILMDIRLKGKIDGIECARIIKEKFNIPFVYLTSYADEPTLERAKITEPYGYLLKPFDERMLQSTIEIALYKHKIEKTLKERERWFSTILKSISDAVIAVDDQGRVTFMNPVAERLVDFKFEDGGGKSLREKIKIAEEEMSIFQKKTQVSKVKLHFPREFVLVAPNSEKIPVEFSDSSIKDEKGNEFGCVLVFRDLRERKMVQEELEQSNKKLRKLLQETIKSLASAAEKRDPYTAGHQERVTRLACAIAEEMNLSPERIEGIQMAGIIHDIGKIYVPAEILSKPTSLDPPEIALIQKHPQVGYEILKGIEFPWPIAEIVLQHHERMLGSGYPRGLQGEEILLEARIIGVADVVEAMYSHRPYRPSLGIEAALKEIFVNRAFLYDPVVVDVCVDLFQKKGFKFEDMMVD